ncbi:DUF3413 domain-containing protein [Escherichia coli]
MVTHRQRYREKVSQMVSWGHWFALFNILLSLVIGSRYLFIADWPTTLAGRIYSYVSIIGHFSFLVFATYLLILFPLTFIVGSQRLMRFLSVILATAGMTLLLIDSEVFTRFHLHLNPIVWQLVKNILWKHVFRNAMLLVIAGFPATFISMFFTGSLLIEVMFSLNGLGLLGYEATVSRDYPVMFGTLYIFTLIGLLLNIVSDISYTLVDPRIDFEGR